MDISPHTVRNTSFKTARKGYDTEEVDRFRESVAAAIETAQNHATAMEARARAAVARLQEMSQAGGAAEAASQPSASANDHETISKTLLLAQRTAETTLAEAKAEANHVLESARAQAAQIVEDARVEARKASEGEREGAENEVQSLLARRDFLLSDTEHLEQHIAAQRERARDVATSLSEMVERVPGGLGDLRRPLLSASADDAPAPAGDDPSATQQVPASDHAEIADDDS